MNKEVPSVKMATAARVYYQAPEGVLPGPIAGLAVGMRVDRAGVLGGSVRHEVKASGHEADGALTAWR